ncbi:hypothetical protein D0Y65_031815 [Glycine soja]|uniref:Uncharacterized protein n=1 Tax=Glycine soja TaxID=3848 RepID=A0A445IA36_GLYSO|nr:hypothetical protein D0Y65_031815 [Glycine soja]
MKIQIMNLMKSLGYQSSFEPVNGTINIFLYPENPFTANSLPIRRERKRESLEGPKQDNYFMAMTGGENPSLPSRVFFNLVVVQRNDEEASSSLLNVIFLLNAFFFIILLVLLFQVTPWFCDLSHEEVSNILTLTHICTSAKRRSNHTSKRFRRVQAKHRVMDSINEYAESLFQVHDAFLNYYYYYLSFFFAILLLCCDFLLHHFCLEPLW